MFENTSGTDASGDEQGLCGGDEQGLCTHCRRQANPDPARHTTRYHTNRNLRFQDDGGRVFETQREDSGECSCAEARCSGLFRCPVGGCDYGNSNSNTFLEHMRNAHTHLRRLDGLVQAEGMLHCTWQAEGA